MAVCQAFFQDKTKNFHLKAPAILPKSIRENDISPHRRERPILLPQHSTPKKVSHFVRRKELFSLSRSHRFRLLMYSLPFKPYMHSAVAVSTAVVLLTRPDLGSAL